MYKKDNSTVKMLKELGKTISSRGYKATISLLRKNQTDIKIDHDDIIGYIYSAVMSRFYISKQELLYGKTRRDRVDALSVVCFCFDKYIKLNKTDICIEVDKSPSQITHYLARINSLREDLSCDKRLLNKLREVETAIKKYLENADSQINAQEIEETE